jgi:hypothetical protein
MFCFLSLPIIQTEQKVIYFFEINKKILPTTTYPARFDLTTQMLQSRDDTTM